jgi:serine/threonine protein kinase
MSIALSEFWTRLVRSGITDAAGCKRLATRFSKARGGTPPSDPVTLAKFMIKLGELTQFQARALLADQAQEIRAGSYVIRSDTSSPPLANWVEATRIDDGQSGYLFRASAQQLEGGRTQWLEAHSAVNAQTLQAFESEPYATSTMIFSPLPAGRCLHDVIRKGGRLPPRKACEIGIAVGDALDAMHALRLIHGSVRSDRVWICDRGQTILLRDPAGPPLEPGGDSSDNWLDSMDQPDTYTAPEFARPVQVCDQATDIYSLGCLLFRLVTGRPAFDSIAAHASEAPPELAEAIIAGQSGDPLYRVIAFALAKDPARRFNTAQQLANALSATLPLLPKVKKSAAAVDKTKIKADKSRSGTLATAAGKREAASKAEKQTAPPEKGPPESLNKDPRVDSTSPAEPPRPPTTAVSPSADSAPQRKTKPAVESRPELKPPASQQEPAPQIRPAPLAPAADSEPAQVDAGIDTAVSRSDDRQLTAPVISEPTPITPQPPPLDEAVARESQSRPLRRRKKKKKSAPLVLGGLCVAVLMLMIGLVVRDPNEPIAEKKPRPPIPDVLPRVSSQSAQPPVQRASHTPPAIESVAGYELVSDDRLLFVPPYAAGTPAAPLELLPPGPSLIISARLASIREHPLGSKLIASLSPELENVIGLITARAKVPVDSISRCSAAMYTGKDGWPEVSLAIELKQPQPSSELIKRWQVAASRTPDGATIYAGDEVDSDAFYLADSGAENRMVSRFAVGSVERISEVAAAEGGAVVLPRSLQTLWNSSSDQADLVVLTTPNFLFADGRSLLQSSAPELVRPLKRVLIPDVAGTVMTAHLSGDQVYAEIRLAPSGISEAALMRAIRDSIQTWPGWADEFIVDSVPDPSWRLLASRLPSMMRFIVDHMRYGISEKSVVANTYLPEQAVLQATLATLLALNTPPGNAPAVVATEPDQPLTLDEMLDREMSVSFGQESLEFAIDAIVGDFIRKLPAGSTLPPIRIIGGDLQLMGITQNQQVRDFSKSGVPLRTVLTDLVLGANPDKTATGPKDPKQALIWVVSDDPDNPGKKVILVTTRQAADGKYELPVEFRSEP